MFVSICLWLKVRFYSILESRNINPQAGFNLKLNEKGRRASELHCFLCLNQSAILRWVGKQKACEVCRFFKNVTFWTSEKTHQMGSNEFLNLAGELPIVSYKITSELIWESGNMVAKLAEFPNLVWLGLLLMQVELSWRMKLVSVGVCSDIKHDLSNSKLKLCFRSSAIVSCIWEIHTDYSPIIWIYQSIALWQNCAEEKHFYTKWHTLKYSYAFLPHWNSCYSEWDRPNVIWSIVLSLFKSRNNYKDRASNQN